MGRYFSLLDWSGFTKEAKFIGLQNYYEAVNDEFFWDLVNEGYLIVSRRIDNVDIEKLLELLNLLFCHT